MSIAMTDDQLALRDAVQRWAAARKPRDTVRAAEMDASAWRSLWPAVCELGLPGLALPESAGGGGGTFADLAVGLEHAAEALVPGPLLTTSLAATVLAGTPGAPGADGLADGSRTAGVAVAPSRIHADADGLLHGLAGPVPGAGAGALAIVTDGVTCWVLDCDDDAVKTVDLACADPSRPLGEIRLDGAPATVLDGVSPQRLADLHATLAAAEASGIASWCLATAVDYAKVREQFGRPIGSFQAIKQLCAQMLCRAETAAAVAWDAAECADDPDQHPLSAAVAAALALDAALGNAKDCIQVLGGIGFTWEHDAHLYLRRALALRQASGPAGRWRRRALQLTADGVRRTLRLSLHDDQRAEVRQVVAGIAAQPADDRRAALVDSGYLTPHWPAPYGLDASPRLQLIVDEELAAAGVERPDLVIAGWAVPTILRYGTAAQIERFVAPSLRGELTWCQLFSEPGAGSDLASLRTRAERVEGGWSLTGQKVWTSVAERADWGICLARTNPDAPKHKGITYFLVDMRSPGLTVRPLREITGEALFNEVFLDEVVVPDDCVVGEVDGGWPLARTTLSHERVAMGGGSSIGDAVERLVEQALASGAEQDPVLADRLGQLIADGLAGALLDFRTTLRQLDGRQDDGAAASVRKLVGVPHRQEVAELALELLGADGMVPGQELWRFLNTRCLSIAGGTTQVLTNVAAERILGLPRG